jgi:hypothetical protein
LALNDSFLFCSRHYAEMFECLRLAVSRPSLALSSVNKSNPNQSM